MITLIDVSEHNGHLDWDAIYQSEKSNGGAIIRIGIGSNYESQDDREAEYNMNECEKRNIPYGVYIYSYALNTDEVRSEVEHVLRMIKGHKPKLGVWFDMEDADGYKERHGLDVYSERDKLTEFCNVFTSGIAAEGHETGVYANLNYYNNVLNFDELNGHKWLAIWGPEECPVSWADMWQCTSDGVIPGATGRVDVNYFINEDLYNELIGSDCEIADYEVAEPTQEIPIEEVGNKHNVGDIVRYNRIYTSTGDWTDGAEPLYTEGTITEVYSGARHPYLINGGTGFVDDNCIIEDEPEEDNAAYYINNDDINVGDEVEVRVNARYEGGSFILYYDTYDVMEVSGDRAVIGKNGDVTGAIKTEYIKKVGTSNSDSSSEIPRGGVHIVEEGETLSSIADLVYGDSNRYPELVEKNGIDNPNLIYVGQEIKY